MIKKIAEFMGWKPGWDIDTGWRWDGTQWHLNENIFNWNLWMREVEPRIRERGLWAEYIEALCDITEIPHFMNDDKWAMAIGLRAGRLVAATLEQRVEALAKVLEAEDEME